VFQQTGELLADNIIAISVKKGSALLKKFQQFFAIFIIIFIFYIFVEA
jgi:hypothetical protein